jgi:pimeloyl-ACP methyl ester carboxylesterase
MRLALLCALLCGLAGCNSPGHRIQAIEAQAQARGWQQLNLPTPWFGLTGYAPAGQGRTDILDIYIEGDGLSFINGRPSSNPTPRNPTGLEMAMAQPTGVSVYLGRPCQYRTDDPACTRYFWSTGRFDPRVIQATSHAIDQLRQHYQARQLRLIGFSGGGAVALLVAANRDDVVQVITAAGCLDHQFWTHLHHVQPLTGSLNPARQGRLLKDLPQVHYSGEQDRTVPPSVAQSYLRQLPKGSPVRLQQVPGLGHYKGWPAHWPDLYRQAVQD